MNQTPCDIIRDLLPLYKDHVCSAKSRNLIEEHLPECRECREYLEAMDKELPPVAPSALEDIQIFRKIARRLNWLKIVGFSAVIVFILFISTVISVIKNYNEHLFDKRIAAEDIRITELYQLKDGDLYVTLESSRLCMVSSYGFILSPYNTFYTESYDNGQSCLSFEKVSTLEHLFLNRLADTKYTFVIPMQETLDPDNLDLDQYPNVPDDFEGTDSSVIIHRNTLVYYEGKNDERITIWKDGQKLEPAPETVEKKVRQHQKEENDEIISPLIP